MSTKPLAEKAATCERPIGSDPRDDVKPAPAEPDAVSDDTFVARPDLGDNSFNLVAAGDRVSAGLERQRAYPPEGLTGVAVPQAGGPCTHR
jgi:hypothetical protein